MIKSFKVTTIACYVGYIVQAIIINIAPLLFACMQDEFFIDLGQLTFIVTITFGVQLLIDALATKLVDKIGYRIIVIFAHVFSFLGLILLGILPFSMNNHYAGIIISMLFASFGSGLIEVVISPLIEAIPSTKSNSSMNFLHSFYCWGYVAVVIIVTAYLSIFGINNWRWLPIVLSIIPLLNGFVFLFVPLAKLVEKEEDKMSIRQLATSKIFIFIFIVMICAGAAEQAICQWASYFAEKGLNVSKTVGDLIGPCAFAALMGIARVLSAVVVNKRMSQETILLISSIGCIVCYTLVAIVSSPIVSLVGCAMCGLFVGAVWPGSINLATKKYANGGTTMFAILALGGDIGCTLGPTVVGWVSDGINQNANGIRLGIGVAILFPLIMVICLATIKHCCKKQNTSLDQTL